MAVNQDYTAEGGVWNEAYHWWEWRDDQGRCHRVDGPAIICAAGYEEWLLNGRLYRVGHEEWLLHGLRHRVDGPAMIWDDGREEWWRHGQRHRVDGPAYIGATGNLVWYVQGRHITREVEAWMQEHDITWPFTPEQIVEFQLRWL